MKDKIKLITFALLPLLLIACTDLSQEEVEKRIASSERLRVLDSFCQNLPRPETFNFVYKKISGNYQEITISYRYHTEGDFSGVKEFYDNYFNRTGWTRETFWGEDKDSHQGQLMYRDGKKTVWIEHVAFPDANYSVGCTQED